ncbi:MAG TPA: FAD-dependent oxidoreductase, partial [Acidimicrobiia bacterium]|nr:FAD-dependent oxidoreductase [Acidimicrobiia bacterium]
MTAPVYVVGAGPSGLAAAWRLRQSGVEVVVLEAGDRAGGKISTRVEDG